MTWAAVHPDHAIERVRLEVTFSENLPKKVVDRARAIFSARRHDLRFGEPVDQEMHQLVIEPNAPQPKLSAHGGWLATKMTRPGVIGEAVALNGGVFTYESTDYRGWTTAKRRLLSVVAELIGIFVEVVEVQAFGLDYVDRFVFNGVAEEANPSAIICEPVISLLHEGARSGEELWHLHRGWFEHPDGKNVLVVQNLDAHTGQTQTGQHVRSVQILTKAEERPRPGTFDDDTLETHLNRLHTLCMTTFAAALTDRAHRMVNMDGNGGARV